MLTGIQHLSCSITSLSPDGTIGGSHSLLVTLLSAPRRCDHDLPSHDFTNLGHALDAGRKSYHTDLHPSSDCLCASVDLWPSRPSPMTGSLAQHRTASCKITLLRSDSVNYQLS